MSDENKYYKEMRERKSIKRKKIMEEYKNLFERIDMAKGIEHLEKNPLEQRMGDWKWIREKKGSARSEAALNEYKRRLKLLPWRDAYYVLDDLIDPVLDLFMPITDAQIIAELIVNERLLFESRYYDVYKGDKQLEEKASKIFKDLENSDTIGERVDKIVELMEVMGLENINNVIREGIKKVIDEYVEIVVHQFAYKFYEKSMGEAKNHDEITELREENEKFKAELKKSNKPWWKIWSD